MSFIADLAKLGILPQQHFPDATNVPGAALGAQGAAVPEDVRITLYGVRITGRDPELGTYTFDSSTYGPIHGGTVWRAAKRQQQAQNAGGVIGSNPFVPATWGPNAPAAPAAGSGASSARVVPLWLYAVAGTVEPAGSVNAQATGLDNLGAGYMAGFPSEKPGPGGGWQRDEGLVPQCVATPFGQVFPLGYPGALLPMSSTSQQNVAFVPAGGVLVAPHHGGDWRLGTPIYDTTPSAAGQGALDPLRVANLQQLVRLYKIGNMTGPAWQLGKDCGGRPGDGMVADSGADANGQDQQGTQTGGGGANTGQGTGAPLNATGAGAGLGTMADLQIRGTFLNPQQPPDANAGQAAPKAGSSASAGAGPGQVLAKATYREFGTHHVGAAQDKHNLYTTVDGEPVNPLHFNPLASWYIKGKDAPMKFDTSAWKKPGPDLPLIVECYLRYDGDDTHDFSTGPRPGRWKWESSSAMDVPDDGDGGGDDPGDPDNPGNPGNPGTPTGGGGSSTTGGGGSSTTGGTGGSSTTGGGSGTSTTGGTPTGGSTATGGGSSTDGTGGSSGSTPTTGMVPGVAGADPTTPTMPGPSPAGLLTTGWTDGYGGGAPGVGPGTPVYRGNMIAVGQRALLEGSLQHFVPGVPSTFSTPVQRTTPVQPVGTLPARGLTYAQQQAIARFNAQRLLMQRRPYLRAPMEVAVPALLARPAPLNTYSADFRFPGKGGMTDAQRSAYERAPIAGKLEAFGNQSGGGWNYQGSSKFGLYRRGVLSRGGFALVPGNVDLHDLVAGRPLPTSLPDAHLMVATTSGVFSHADPHVSGKPINGFVHQRSTVAANGSYPFSIKGALADGSFGNQSLWAYGTDAAGANQTGTNTTHVPSRGTGTGAGGEFQVAVGVAGGAGSTVHGATTRFRVTNNGLRFQNSDLSLMFQLDNSAGPASVGFFGVTPASQQSTFGAITNSTGGVPSTTYAAVPVGYSQADQQTRWASVADQIGKLRSALVAYGLST